MHSLSQPHYIILHIFLYVHTMLWLPSVKHHILYVLNKIILSSHAIIQIHCDGMSCQAPSFSTNMSPYANMGI